MRRFLVVRRFSVTESDMPVVGRRSRELVEVEFPEITWEHSHVVVDAEGNVSTYCVYGAPSEDVVHAHSKRLGDHTIEGLLEIAGDVTPADFPAPA
jgi:Nickel responsive protein SCO4226-like